MNMHIPCGDYQLSVDVGGTFTDFVFSYDDGGTELLKSISTPGDISEAISTELRRPRGGSRSTSVCS